MTGAAGSWLLLAIAACLMLWTVLNAGLYTTDTTPSGGLYRTNRLTGSTAFCMRENGWPAPVVCRPVWEESR